MFKKLKKIINKIPGALFITGLVLMFPAEEAGFSKAVIQVIVALLLLTISAGLEGMLEEEEEE